MNMLTRYLPERGRPFFILGAGFLLCLFLMGFLALLFASMGSSSKLSRSYAPGNYRADDSVFHGDEFGKRKAMSGLTQQYEGRKYLRLKSSSGGSPVQLVPVKAPGRGKERKLIHRASMGMRVGNLEGAGKKVRELVAARKGYIASEKYMHETTSRTIRFKLRVPRGEFKSALAELEKLSAHTAHRRVQVNDVTEKFIDMSIRLRAKRATENQYLIVLRRARKVSEILEVRKKIGEIRAEIETMEGRLRYLSNQVQFSTIDLSIYVYSWTPSEERGFITRLLRGVVSGWRGLLTVFIGLMSIWPLWLLVGLVFAGVRRYRRNREKPEAK